MWTDLEIEILNKQLFHYCREKAQQALWFAKTYGINLKTLEMEDSTGKPITVDLASGKRNWLLKRKKLIQTQCNACVILDLKSEFQSFVD